MIEKFTNEYRPDMVSIPGETLAEILEDRGMSQAELAARMGRPRKTINEIAKGKSELTPETALQLERVLGIPASFWGNLERNYRDFVARQAEREQFQEHLEWPSHFPISQLAKLGWLDPGASPTDRVRSLLSFFGISSITQWKSRYEGQLAAFRLAKKFAPDIYALTAWLREGERRAHQVECRPFDLGAFRRALEEARALTTESDPDVFVPRLVEINALCGVAVVLVPELTGSRACGATRWLGPQKAMIQLSLRYKSNDQLWFTFFHEAAHIVLHGKKEVFVEVMGGKSGARKQEEEADRWAAERLIPSSKLEQLIARKPFSRATISLFAEEIGVAAGIVVGRLQHDGVVDFSHFNALKVRYQWIRRAD